MLHGEEEVDDVERCREARRALERRYKTLDGLLDHFLRLQRKRSRNIALGRRLLAKRGAVRGKSNPASRRRRGATAARRSA